MEVRATQTTSSLKMCYLNNSDIFRTEDWEPGAPQSRNCANSPGAQSIFGRPYVCDEKRQNLRSLSYFFRENNFLVTVLNVALVLKLVLENSQATVYILYKMSGPKAFEAQLCFHVTALISRELKSKKMNFFGKVSYTSLADMSFQLL